MQHLPANSFVHDTGQPLRVLVVDDSTAQRHVLVVLLRQWGFVVDQAASG
jgi:CheY-like chemotaxis protein